jgi:DNA-directed RNA polymerase II subunit RPB1
MNSGEPILQCLVADDNADDLLIRIQVFDDSGPKSSGGGDEDGDEDGEACRDMIDNLKTLEKTILENVVIRGIPGIQGASMSKEETLVKKDGDYVKLHRWVIDTDGVNLSDVLIHPAVDATRTYCN